MSFFKDKVVAITGGSDGIGRALVNAFIQAGAKVATCGRNYDKLYTLQLRHSNVMLHTITCDVSKEMDCKRFIDSTIKTFGGIDVLINNAGIMPLSPLAALETANWDAMIDVNIRGVLNGIAAALPGFTAQGSGHFVNVASLGAHYVVPTGAVYCATKFAVWAITDGIRQEHQDIRATIISPGVVESELGHDITDPDSAAAMAEFRSIAITPDAIARAIRFAVGQPADVDVSEIIVRPVKGSF